MSWDRSDLLILFAWVMTNLRHHHFAFKKVYGPIFISTVYIKASRCLWSKSEKLEIAQGHHYILKRSSEWLGIKGTYAVNQVEIQRHQLNRWNAFKTSFFFVELRHMQTESITSDIMASCQYMFKKLHYENKHVLLVCTCAFN